MSGSRFPWLPVLVLTAATVWAAAGSGAATSRDDGRGWVAPTLLAQVAPGGTDEGGEDGDEEFDPSDTLGVREDDPLTPDTTQIAPPSSVPQATPPDTLHTATPDTSMAAPLDTLRAASLDTLGATPLDTLRATPTALDSARAAARRAAAVDSGVGETLFVAKPRPQPSKQAPAAEQAKPRSGILGIHPIAILLGLAALHFFVTKAMGD